MSMIRLVNMTKRFGKTVAVKNANLEIEKGEFVVFLGPSGCGKTTTLRCIAGLENPEEGEIYIDGEMVNDLPTLDRDVGFVFQHYALFPHMNAYQNISFPLRAMKHKKSEIKEEVMKVAGLLRIEDILQLKPSHLSGGDLQSVALARALVIKPKVFLLDEPLSTLDAEFREEARTMIKRIHLEIGATTIYVTHDQMEAMAIADRIVTMNFGEIQQVQSPEYVYHNPVNMFVANFLGSPGMNFIDCALVGNDTLKLGLDGKSLQIDEKIVKKIKAVGEGKTQLKMGIRPEDIKLSFTKDTRGFDMKVAIVEEIGPENIINLRSGDYVLKVLTDPDFLPKTGETVWAVPEQDKIRIFDQETQKEIL
jgi:multiple sugar transport system ATP-binding protein